MKLGGLLFALIFPLLLLAQNPISSNKKVLIVVSSYGKGEGKKRPGYEFEEFSQAYLVFKANGFGVDVASPKGGSAEPDAFNKTKPYNKLVLEDSTAMRLLRHTIPTANIKTSNYQAVYVVGGKGAMFDLPVDPSLQEIISTIYYKQKGVVAAVCHGPAALVNVKDDEEKYLLAGKKVSGFSNEEEKKFGKTWISEFPFLLEDKLKARGVFYESSEAMLPQVTVDGRLVTGQNPFSTAQLAEEIIRAIGFIPVKRELYKDERSMSFVKRAVRGDSTWARNEIKANTGLYDTELIAVYGYYKIIKANEDINEIKQGISIIELVEPWVFNENLHYEMAKAYIKLNNKEKAKTLLSNLIAKKPAFEEAKKLFNEIK